MPASDAGSTFRNLLRGHREYANIHINSATVSDMSTNIKKKLIHALPKRAYLQARWLVSKYRDHDAFERRQRMRHICSSSGYSLKPFDDTESIFVHIPKCAGVSVNKALYGNLGGAHTTLDQYIRTFEPASILRYFKFTIVRNPWDRLVSAYHFLKRGGFHEADRAWADTELCAYDNFDDFVRRWVNDKNVWKWPHFRPQYHYITDRYNKISLDFIGMVENIESDFAYIAERVGVAHVLPRNNTGEHLHFSAYYSELTKKIVANVYQRDIALLGYSFDNSSRLEQIRWRDMLCLKSGKND
jgi:hypothetical protein